MKTLFAVTLFLVGCSADLGYCPEEEEPAVNGFCEVDDECADTDFCLLEWCDGPECRPWNRCMLRSLPGDGCEAENHCPKGMWCILTDDPVHGTCGDPAQ